MVDASSDCPNTGSFYKLKDQCAEVFDVSGDPRPTGTTDQHGTINGTYRKV